MYAPVCFPTAFFNIHATMRLCCHVSCERVCPLSSVFPQRNGENERASSAMVTEARLTKAITIQKYAFSKFTLRNTEQNSQQHTSIDTKNMLE